MDDRINPPATNSSSPERRSKRQRNEAGNYNVKRTLSDMLNPQAKKPKPQPSVGAETYQSRANDAVENFNGILAEMQRELQDAKKQNAEMSHKIKSAEEAKRASEDEVLAATEKERKKFVELQLEIARRDIEEMKNKESYERLVVAAKGVVGSNAREFGDRVAELEGALNGL